VQFNEQRFEDAKTGMNTHIGLTLTQRTEGNGYSQPHDYRCFQQTTRTTMNDNSIPKTTTTQTMTKRDAYALAAHLVERSLKEITIHPEVVKTELKPVGSILVTVMGHVHAGDMKRALGTGGAHSKALNFIAEKIGERYGVPMRARLAEPTEGADDMHGKFVPKSEWPRDRVRDLAQSICDAIFRFPSRTEIHDSKEIHESVLDISVDRRESSFLVDQAQAHIRALFNAIGKMNGRMLLTYAQIAETSGLPK
jgi:hypothetical protein